MPELPKRSLPPKGSEPKPPNGSTLGLGDADKDDPKGSGLFDFGGAGRGGGGFLFLEDVLGLEESPKGSALKLLEI